MIMGFILNDEQILELCLIAIGHNGLLLDEYPGEFLTYYVLRTAQKEMSNEDVAEAISDLITAHAMESLVKNGYLEASFDEDGKINMEITSKVVGL